MCMQVDKCLSVNSDLHVCLLLQTFGQIPLLRDGDFELVQSNAILRYLARKHGTTGLIHVSAFFIMMSARVCAYVFLLAYRENHTSNFTKFLCVLPVIYFRFSG